MPARKSSEVCWWIDLTSMDFWRSVGKETDTQIAPGEVTFGTPQMEMTSHNLTPCITKIRTWNLAMLAMSRPLTRPLIQRLKHNLLRLFDFIFIDQSHTRSAELEQSGSAPSIADFALNLIIACTEFTLITLNAIRMTNLPTGCFRVFSCYLPWA